LNRVGEKRQERTEAVSDFYTSKNEAEREAENLDHKVDELENQLTHAKELRRRNSLRLEQAVSSQEAGPYRSG